MGMPTPLSLPCIYAHAAVPTCIYVCNSVPTDKDIAVTATEW